MQARPIADAMIYIAGMNITSATEVKYLKGVGPQRAAAFASRGIHYGERFAALSAVSIRGPHSLQSNRGDRARRHLYDSRHRWRCGSCTFYAWQGSHLPLIDWRCDRDASMQILSRQLSSKDAFARGRTSSCTAKRISIRGRRPNRNDQSAIRAGWHGRRRTPPRWAASCRSMKP